MNNLPLRTKNYRASGIEAIKRTEEYPHPAGQEVRRNLVPNPSFGTGLNGWGISGAGAATLSRSTSWSKVGTYSAMIENKSASDANDMRMNTAYTSGFMTPGKTFTISGTVRYEVDVLGTSDRRPRILVFTRVGSGSYNPMHSPLAPLTAGEYDLSHTVTIPAGVTEVIVGFAGAMGAVANCFWDAIKIEELPIMLPYFDGSHNKWDVRHVRPEWVGSPHNSPSILVSTGSYTTRSWTDVDYEAYDFFTVAQSYPNEQEVYALHVNGGNVLTSPLPVPEFNQQTDIINNTGRPLVLDYPNIHVVELGSGQELVSKAQQTSFSLEMDVSNVSYPNGKDGGGEWYLNFDRLRFENFGVRLPRGLDPEDVVLKAEVRSGWYYYPVGGGLDGVYLNVGMLEVFADIEFNGQIIGEEEDAGFVRINQQPHTEASLEKTYQYNVRRDGKFLREWTDVESKPRVQNSVNNLPGEFTVSIAKNLEDAVYETDEIAITGYDVEEDDNNVLLTHTQESILATIRVEQAVGEGSDVAVDNEVDVMEYYGGFENLVTSDGEDLLTSDLEPLVTEVGYPFGRYFFRGFISKYNYGYVHGKRMTNVRVLSHVDEWNNIVLESEDVLRSSVAGSQDRFAVTQLASARSRQTGINGQVAQTFRHTGAFELSTIVLKMGHTGGNQLDASSYPSVTLKLKQGTPTGAGAILATATNKVTKAYDSSNPVYEDVAFSFDNVQLAANTTYSWIVEHTSFSGIALGQLSETPVVVQHSGGDASGIQGSVCSYSPYGGTFPKNDPGTWSSPSGLDFAFSVYERGGDWVVKKNSKDPAQMLREVADFGKTRGSRISYSETSIVNTNTVVSGKFNVAKLTNAADTILKYAPSDWSLYYDPARLEVNLKPRPEIVKHWLTLGENIEELELEEDIESIVNEVYFTGGKDGVTGEALTMRVVDAISQREYRRGLQIISDQRVTDPATAQIIIDSAIGRNSEPVIVGTLKILRKYYEEVIEPSELLGFRAFGNHIDYMRLQAVKVDTERERMTVQLGLLLPPVSKRMEDIRRNLEELEMQNSV